MHFPHFLLDHLRWGFVANERVGATKAIPEVVNLVRLLADERGGGRRAFALLQTFAKRLLLGVKGIASLLVVGLRTLEWKLKKMSREVPCPSKAKSVYVLLVPVVRHANSDRHGLLSAPKLQRYCHNTFVTTDWDRRRE